MAARCSRRGLRGRRRRRGRGCPTTTRCALRHRPPRPRFGMEIADLGGRARGHRVQGLRRARSDSGGVVRGINAGARGGAALGAGRAHRARAGLGAKGLVWAFVEEDGGWRSPIAKFLSDDEIAAIGEAPRREAGRPAARRRRSAGVGRRRARAAAPRAGRALRPGARRAARRAAGWSTSRCSSGTRSERRWDALHHPSPRPRATSTIPARCARARYDLVLDGFEIGGGSIRIHRLDVQERVLELHRHRARGGAGALRLPARRAALRRTAARRHRHGPRPHRRDHRRLGRCASQHPRESSPSPRPPPGPTRSPARRRPSDDASCASSACAWSRRRRTRTSCEAAARPLPPGRSRRDRCSRGRRRACGARARRRSGSGGPGRPGGRLEARQAAHRDAPHLDAPAARVDRGQLPAHGAVVGRAGAEEEEDDDVALGQRGADLGGVGEAGAGVGGDLRRAMRRGVLDRGDVRLGADRLVDAGVDQPDRDGAGANQAGGARDGHRGSRLGGLHDRLGRGSQDGSLGGVLRRGIGLGRRGVALGLGRVGLVDRPPEAAGDGRLLHRGGIGLRRGVWAAGAGAGAPPPSSVFGRRAKNHRPPKPRTSTRTIWKGRETWSIGTAFGRNGAKA